MMKRITKKNIINMMQTMREAHNHAPFLIREHHLQEARELLAQCQECAVQIGESIEKSEGMDTQAVMYLEAYCEHLYEMSHGLGKKRTALLKQRLDDCLYNVEKEINENIRLEKIKVVFMPYKVSMWDCMESVWKAAEEDQTCETYVVPIPYYEKNENGEIQEMCYEGKAFPEYVPITYYKEFLLERELPDIIYIHNPYDGANYVTSVHPDYFSSKLKKYTNKLVYIPYYISGDEPMDEAHRNLPAYYYMDKIILQDENKSVSLYKYVSKAKMVVMGSPKAERLLELNARKRKIVEAVIPQRWREKIAGKAVVLFNVSISGVLKNSDSALEKIRYVISEFDEKEDAVLLWRPHPLIEATLKTMRPEMYKEYIQIKSEFIEKEKGIFDETEDAGIAVVISDAYLGEDSSSLVHYFGVLGKPVLYTNWKILENKQKDRDYLYICDYFFENSELYFVPNRRGFAHILFKLNLENGRIEKECEFPGTPNNVEACYYGISKLNSKIVLIPHNGEDIYVYDTRKGRATKVVLSVSQTGIQQFTGSVEYENKLYLIPYGYPAIVCLDIQTLEVCEFKECISPFYLKNRQARMFSEAWVKKGQYLYLASSIDSRILIFDMKNLESEIKKIGDYSYGYGHMVYDGEYFWLSAYGINRVVRWDEEYGGAQEYVYPIDEERPAEEIWSLLLDGKDEIVVCPSFSVKMILIDKKTGVCRYHRISEDALGSTDGSLVGAWEGFMSVKAIDKRTVAMFVRKDSSFYLWDVHTDQWKCYPCRLPIKEIHEIEKKQIEKYYVMRTTPYSLSENDISISQYVDYVAVGDVEIFKRNYDCYKGRGGKVTIGMDVHEYIKKLLE